MGKKSSRKSRIDFVSRGVGQNPDLIPKIDDKKPGWRKHAKKLLAEQHNSKVDLTKQVIGPKDLKKLIKKMTKEAVQKRIEEIKEKQASQADQSIVSNNEIPANAETVAITESKTE